VQSDRLVLIVFLFFASMKMPEDKIFPQEKSPECSPDFKVKN